MSVTWWGSRRMRWELGFVTLAVAATVVFFLVLFSGDPAPVEPDGGDDPGPIAAIVTVLYTAEVFVVAVALVAIVEVVVWVARRRTDDPRTR